MRSDNSRQYTMNFGKEIKNCYFLSRTGKVGKLLSHVMAKWLNQIRCWIGVRKKQVMGKPTGIYGWLPWQIENTYISTIVPGWVYGETGSHLASTIYVSLHWYIVLIHHAFALLIHPDPDISRSTPGISEMDYGQSSLSPGAFVLVKYPHQKQAVQSR